MTTLADVHSPRRLRSAATIVAAAMLMCPAVVAVPHSAPSGQQSPAQLVILVLCLGRREQVSVSYSRQVPRQEIDCDFARLSRELGVRVGVPTVTLAGSSVPGSRPSTSASVTLRGLVIRESGYLPLEPFINTFRRFSPIQIIYLNVPRMRYRGLEDYGNRFVKIQMSRKGGTYSFAVAVRGTWFGRLRLPTLRPAWRTEATGQAAGPRVILIVGVVLVAAAALYVILRRTLGRAS